MATSPQLRADGQARLTGAERRRLRQLEQVVEQNLAAWLKVTTALVEIRDRRLYRETHPSFEAFVADRFGIKRRTAYAWIEAAEVLAVHPNAHGLSRSHLRLLAPLDPAVRAELIPRLHQTTVDDARAEVASFRTRTGLRRRPLLKNGASEPAPDATLQLLCGDALEQLQRLPSDSISCCVTSVPYWQKRSYGDIPGEIGHEPTVEEYLDKLVPVFREVRRVLHRTGSCWLIVGDSYGSRSSSPRRQIPHDDGRPYSPYAAVRTPVPTTAVPARRGSHRDRKELMLVPARLALALQEDGFHLRSENIWAKPAPMPESVDDRPTVAHEHVYLFVNDRDAYYYDQQAVAEPRVDGAGLRNLRSVWLIPTVSYPGEHQAVMPPELAARCIAAGSSAAGVCPHCRAPHLPAQLGAQRRWQQSCDCPPTAPLPSTILDPFAGLGTVPLVALQLGRSAIGIDLNPDYRAEAHARISEAVALS